MNEQLNEHNFRLLFQIKSNYINLNLNLIRFGLHCLSKFKYPILESIISALLYVSNIYV